ncbi:hypothetical protein FRC04_010218 [Tulasnella sp. 424]|nr:hypothetical protein FRC04_010218 [Tulasnella sp. 424]KAG8966410.1 hypothetical protein FRC05_002656 [Tulasnella sp. 425]
MKDFDINELLGLERDSDEHVSNPLEGPSDIFNPLNLLPDPLLSGIPTFPPPTQTSVVSPTSTEEEAVRADNLPFLEADSRVLPPDIQTSAVATAEMPPALAPVVPQPSIQPTASSVSPLPVSSASFRPTTAYMAPSGSPPARKRRYSHVDEPIQPQEPIPGPSNPRPAKRPRTRGSLVDEPDQPRAPTPGPSRPRTSGRLSALYPGQSSFQLDPTVVAPLRPSSSSDRPVAVPRPVPDYSKCKCPNGPTQKPHRHWKSCRSNPDRGQKPFQCEICGERYMTKFSKNRHIEREHM